MSWLDSSYPDIIMPYRAIQMTFYDVNLSYPDTIMPHHDIIMSYCHGQGTGV